MHLFPQTMLDVWKLHGDTFLGQVVQPEHRYNWKTTLGGVVTEDVYSIAEYLCPFAIPGLWNTYDLVVATAILYCELSVDPEREYDMLYVGGGSGRFRDAVAAWETPLKCYSIDNHPASVELMGLRGVPCELMDAHDLSAFEDGRFPLVVLAPWALDASVDPETVIAEAVRVASERVICSGWLVDQDDEAPTTYTEVMTNWKGETETRVGTARHFKHVIGMLNAAGATSITDGTFLSTDDEPADSSWLIKVGV